MTGGSTIRSCMTTPCSRGSSSTLNWSPLSPSRNCILSESSHVEHSSQSLSAGQGSQSRSYSSDGPGDRIQPDGTGFINESHHTLNSPDNEIENSHENTNDERLSESFNEFGNGMGQHSLQPG